MKKILIIASVAGIFSTACKTSQVPSTDDVYAIPTEERKLAQNAAQDRLKNAAIEKKQQEDALAGQKAQEENNPRYKEPSYRADDYYDYEYASRLNRFHNPVYGAGYYDPYYTNLYTYNQNPAMWGTSIYSSYNYGMPSGQFSNLSFGISSGFGYGYGGGYGYNGWNNCNYNNYYSPWCNNYGYYGNWGSPYNGWGYNDPYYNGYNSGYYHGWNNAQWGYYNVMDANSGYSKVQYGPRGSTGGGNDQRRTAAGMAIPEDGGRRQFLEKAAQQQAETPRFGESSGQRNRGGNNANEGRIRNERSGNTNEVSPANPGRNTEGDQRPARQNSPRIRQNEQNPNQQNPNQENNNQRNKSNPSNDNRGNQPAPRQSGGGTNRPR